VTMTLIKADVSIGQLPLSKELSSVMRKMLPLCPTEQK
jgi:hypothetical protein